MSFLTFIIQSVYFSLILGKSPIQYRKYWNNNDPKYAKSYTKKYKNV